MPDLRENDDDFCRKLPSFFLDHLPSVTYLRISTCHADCFVSRQYHWYNNSQKEEKDTLPWDVFSLPKLKAVHFHGILVCKKLLGFFDAHEDRLEHITFSECVAVDVIEWEWKETWGDIFKVLASAEAPPLQYLEISAIEGPVRLEADLESVDVTKLPEARGFAYISGNRELRWSKRHGALYPGDTRWHMELREIINENKMRGERSTKRL
ncbi:uncharacterized protein BDZ99DRAFT_467194 [Mytilinidion resinicola]|uniref:F-box domain-containing protein n=1 Tax=Mytilinidion resinicola TaxID=574789 RepID=A0A6A6Y8V6_9PEZI|nr:uncharacterized protein BDZ99DRAFT_467194 [Mytilinidion resinicola]KAF2804983.1 hypothetical protein BDZ99DRAFT_467194 [Mytilinidion resinicola]